MIYFVKLCMLKKNLRKIFIIIFPILFLLIFNLSLNAKAVNNYTLSGNNYFLMTDNINVYAIQFNNNEVKSSIFNENNYQSINFKTIGKVKFITVSDGCIYAISLENTDLIINKYTFKNDSLYYYNLGNLKINSKYKFCVLGDKIYFAENDNITDFVCYNIYGEKLYSFSVNETIDYTMNYNENNLYIFSRNNIYMVNTYINGTPENVLSNVNLRDNIFILNNSIFDYNGNIIDLNLRINISTGITYDKLNGGVIKDYYCKYENGYIYGFDKNGNKNIIYKLDFNCDAQMCCLNEKLYILSEYGKFSVISDSELLFPNKTEDNISNNTKNPINNHSINNISNSDITAEDTNIKDINSKSSININDNVNQNKEFFSINNYNVDEYRNIIWNIPDGTTIAVFKKNLSYNDYNIEFYNKDNVKKTSGKIGTGFVMIVNFNNSEYAKYTLSVKGELTGEGNINTNDFKLLCNYIMGNTEFNDIQYVSADLNNDGFVNSIDTLILSRKINL